MIEVPAGTRAMLVRRGNMEVVLPIAADTFMGAPTSTIVATVLPGLIERQRENPGRATDPIKIDQTPVALRVIGRDSALHPDLPLSLQTEGLWEIRKLPVQAQSDATARLPVCAFELVDVERPSVIFAHAGQRA